MPDNDPGRLFPESSRDIITALAQLSDKAVIGIGCDAKIFLWNSAAQNDLGLPDRNGLDDNVSAFLPEKLSMRVQQILDNAIAANDSGTVRMEMPLSISGSDPVDFIVSCMPFRNDKKSIAGIVLTVENPETDASLLKQHRQLSDRLRVISEYVHEWEYWIDADGEFKYMSPSCKRLTGYTAKEFLATPSLMVAITHPDDRMRVSAHFREEKTESELNKMEFRIINRDCVECWIEHTCQPVFEPDGKYQGRRASNRDITERKKEELKRIDLEMQLRNTDKLESLDILAGGIAHDFNNLLQAILGYSSLVISDLAPYSPTRIKIEMIEKAARRAVELTGEMLAYTGDGGDRLQQFDLNDLLQNMMHRIEDALSSTAVLDLEMLDHSLDITADPAQIKQLVNDLVVRASNSLQESAGIITISSGRMDCNRNYLDSLPIGESLPDGKYVYFRVADSGDWLDDASIEKLFDPSSTTHKDKPAPDLQRVLKIVTGMGGGIHVRSIPGEGTAITVLFSTETTASRISNRTDSTSIIVTILVIDDEELVRSLVREMLEKKNYKVMTAVDGREGVEKFYQYADEIDCVLLDLVMPNFNGEEVFQELKRIRPNVRVILSSGYHENDVIKRFTGAKPSGFIKKPYQAHKLIEIILSVIQ